MWDKKTNTNPQIDSTNIFEDFTWDAALDKEVKAVEEKQEKNMFYYLRISGNFLKIINLFFVLFLCMFLIYSFFQNRDSSENYGFFAPVCHLLLWDVANDVSGCFGINYYSWQIAWNLEETKKDQFDQITPLFQHVYELDSFTNSKEVTFLLEKTDSRLRPLQVLADFDKLKNKFEPIDKSKVVCEDIVIRDDMTLSARCEAYSSDWDSDITTTDKDDKNAWTSISIASSFIDFIENTDGSHFRVIDKQRIFDFTNVSGNGIYTKKTNFDLNLRYTNTNNLAL